MKDDFRKKIGTYLAAAFGLVAALAWNDAIVALINHLFPLSKDTLVAKFVYAIVLTLVVVWVTAIVVRLTEDEKK